MSAPVLAEERKYDLFYKHDVRCVTCFVYDDETRAAAQHWLEAKIPSSKTKEIVVMPSPELCLAKAMATDDGGVVTVFWTKVTDIHRVFSDSGNHDALCYEQRMPLNGSGMHMVYFGGMTRRGLGMINKMAS